MMTRSYAIGDIHGQLPALLETHRLIRQDRDRTGDGDAPVIHLGDLVDRGPDVRGVIETLMEGMAGREPWLAVKGNHDRMFGLFIDDPLAVDPGLKSALSYLNPRIGGQATLASYGVPNAQDRPIAKVHDEALARVPQEHLDFLAALPLYHSRGECLFVHAGLRPDIPLPDQTEDDLLWIREPFLSDRRDHGPLIVHGHTAIAAAVHYGNRVNLDSGAGYGNPLTVVVIEGRQVWLLGPGGRVPLPVTPGADDR